MPGSCDVSDACDELGVPAVRTGAMRPVWPGCPALLATLSTITLTSGQDADPLPDVLAAIAGMPAAVVLLMDLGGRPDAQCWGGRTAAAAHRAGVAGVLVHGAVRDVDALAGAGFATYASGVYPGRAKGRLRYVGTGLPVTIGGELVHPGSLVAADSSGAIFVPPEYAGTVFTRAIALAEAG
jgi:4-hydroxy-4-methyl-2-oxoglutarate aldolase